MRVHWLQHVEHEDLGSIAPWMAARGHTVSCSRLHRGELPPAPDAYDWLIVLGGPMNIYQHAEHPWLVAEKQAIRAALLAEKRVLGICLGAQLLADQLGGPVVKSPVLEIGWYAVKITEAAASDTLFRGFPSEFMAFHWHGDSFTMPYGAVPLMASAACANQAFSAGPKVVGIQFHLEATAANARDWLAVERPTAAPSVQTTEAILAAMPHFAANNRLMLRLLENIEAAD